MTGPELTEREMELIAEAAEDSSLSLLSSPRPEPEGWPAPLAEQAFYGLAGEIVGRIEPHSEADPAALLLQLLVAFGNACGRGPGFVVEGDLHATNLYTVLVGETSRARKGTSWGRVLQLAAQVDEAWARECVADGLSSGEGLIHAVRDPIREPAQEEGKEDKLIDAGAPDKRLMVQEGEFASVLRRMKREGNTLSPVMRTLWDRGMARTITKANAERATDAHVSIVGHITREELRRELTATDAANGFANRFLFACTKRSKRLPHGGSLEDAALGELAGRLREALRAAGVQGVLGLSPAADALWVSEYEALSEGRPGLYGAVIGRAEAQVRRLAVVYALLDQNTVVEEPHLQAALALWRYCDDSARHTFGASLGDPLADRLLAELRAAEGGLTRSEIRRRVGTHRSELEIETALRTLAEHGLAWESSEQTGGRPAQRWRVPQTVERAEPEREAAEGAAEPREKEEKEEKEEKGGSEERNRGFPTFPTFPSTTAEQTPARLAAIPQAGHAGERRGRHSHPEPLPGCRYCAGRQNCKQSIGGT